MAKLSVTPRSLEETKRAIELKLNSFVTKTDVLDQVANDYINQIRHKGLDPETNHPFDPLAKSTIERRKRLSTVNSTGKGYSPAKSNLTFTGQLVSSVKATFQKAKGLLIIEPKGVHKSYKGIRKKRLGKNMRNVDLAKILSEQGRNILGTSQKTNARIVAIIKKSLKKYISNVNR